MAIDPNVFSALQAKAVAEKRRISLDEWTSNGGDPNDYHKVYGTPDNEAFAKASQYYGSIGQRIPIKEMLAMGIAPTAIPRVYGDPPARNIQDLFEQEQQRIRQTNDVAVAGTRGNGPDFGTAQQIRTTILPDAPTMEAATIAPVATVNDLNLGNASQAQTAVIDPATQVSLENAFRAKQEALANELQATANGERPSLAEAQIKTATDRNNAQAMGLIASQRGVNAGLATRLALNQVGDANQTAVMNGSQARLAEAIAARQELASLAEQARGQDAAIQTSNAQAVNARASTQAQLAQQTNQFNANATDTRAVAQGDLSARLALANQLAINNQNSTQAQLVQQANQVNQQGKLNTNLQQGTINQATNIANQNAVNQMELNRAQAAAGIKQTSISGAAQTAAAQAAASGQVAAANVNANASVFNNTVDNATNLTIAGVQSGNNYGNAVNNVNTSNANTASGLVGAGVSAIGQVGASAASGGATKSDERAKKDIKGADSDIEKFLSALEAKKYQYKEPEKEGSGRKIGVMAQDLEDTDIGNSFVKDTPDGKVVDYGQGLGAMMASLASLNKRLQSLEGRN